MGGKGALHRSHCCTSNSTNCTACGAPRRPEVHHSAASLGAPLSPPPPPPPSQNAHIVCTQGGSVCVGERSAHARAGVVPPSIYHCAAPPPPPGLATAAAPDTAPACYPHFLHLHTPWRSPGHPELALPPPLACIARCRSYFGPPHPYTPTSVEGWLARRTRPSSWMRPPPRAPRQPLAPHATPSLRQGLVAAVVVAASVAGVQVRKLAGWAITPDALPRLAPRHRPPCCAVAPRSGSVPAAAATAPPGWRPPTPLASLPR